MKFISAKLVVVALILLATIASATTVLHDTVDGMTRNADLVMGALVEKVETVIDKRDARRIQTRVTFRDIKVFKGRAVAPTMAITLPGGATSEWSLRIPGMPSFHQGDEVVVFLERTSKGWTPSGLSQGVFRVVRDQSGVRRATRDTTDMERISSGADRTLFTHVHEDSEDNLPLTDLIRAIENGMSLKGGVR